MNRRRPRRGRTPLVVGWVAAVAVVFFALPLAGLLARVPWSRLGSILADDVVADALVLSLGASLTAALLSAVLGIPLAWVLARTEFRAKRIVRGLVTLPMVLPPVVAGAALLFAFGRRGLIGEPLADATGLVLPFSFWGVVMATTFVSMPFLVVTVEAALHALDPRFEGAAATLGAPPRTVFRTVTLPMIAPALGAGLALSWARALGEFGATVTFAGNLQGRTQTMPLAVFIALQTDRDAAVALSLVLVAVSLAVLLLLRDRWFGGGGRLGSEP